MVDNGSPSCRRGKSGEARAAGEGNRGREKNPEREMKGEEGKGVGLLEMEKPAFGVPVSEK